MSCFLIKSETIQECKCIFVNLQVRGSSGQKEREREGKKVGGLRSHITPRLGQKFIQKQLLGESASASLG